MPRWTAPTHLVPLGTNQPAASAAMRAYTCWDKVCCGAWLPGTGALLLQHAKVRGIISSILEIYCRLYFKRLYFRGGHHLEARNLKWTGKLINTVIKPVARWFQMQMPSEAGQITWVAGRLAIGDREWPLPTPYQDLEASIMNQVHCSPG